MVVLDPGAVEVGVVTFEDPVGLPEEDTERPVGTPEEAPCVGVVEFAGPVGTDIDGEPEPVGTDLEGPVVGTIGGVLTVDIVKFGEGD